MEFLRGGTLGAQAYDCNRMYVLKGITSYHRLEQEQSKAGAREENSNERISTVEAGIGIYHWQGCVPAVSRRYCHPS